MQARMISDFDLSMSKADWLIHFAISSETLNVTETSVAISLPSIDNLPWIKPEFFCDSLFDKGGTLAMVDDIPYGLPGNTSLPCDISKIDACFAHKKSGYSREGIPAFYEIFEILFFCSCCHDNPCVILLRIYYFDTAPGTVARPGSPGRWSPALSGGPGQGMGGVFH